MYRDHLKQLKKLNTAAGLRNIDGNTTVFDCTVLLLSAMTAGLWDELEKLYLQQFGACVRRQQLSEDTDEWYTIEVCRLVYEEFRRDRQITIRNEGPHGE